MLGFIHFGHYDYYQRNLSTAVPVPPPNTSDNQEFIVVILLFAYATCKEMQKSTNYAVYSLMFKPESYYQLLWRCVTSCMWKACSSTIIEMKLHLYWTDLTKTLHKAGYIPRTRSNIGLLFDCFNLLRRQLFVWRYYNKVSNIGVHLSATRPCGCRGLVHDRPMK